MHSSKMMLLNCKSVNRYWLMGIVNLAYVSLCFLCGSILYFIKCLESILFATENCTQKHVHIRYRKHIAPAHIR